MIEFYCSNRETTVYIDPTRITMVKSMTLVGTSGKKISQIFLDHELTDGKGPVMVFENAAKVSKLVATAKINHVIKTTQS
ncbi:MAG: hypothetical protein EKK37_17295 [Sphingobacteriales bacterium]|nr:MAG: hypothetical protein EKK37_17295 [Sphingobacteriales bacterium]